MVLNAKSEKDEDNRGTAGCMGALQSVRHAVLNLKHASNKVCLCKVKDPDNLHSVRARFCTNACAG